MPGNLQERLPKSVGNDQSGEVISTMESVFRLIDSPNNIEGIDLYHQKPYKKKLDQINPLRRKRWHF